MNYKLKTSKKTQEILNNIKEKTGITPNILARYAISLALIDESQMKIDIVDSNGQEFYRNVLLGDMDEVFRLLIIQKEGKPIPDEKYFPEYIKKYLEYGIILLQGHSELTKNRDNFIRSLVQTCVGGSLV